MSRRHKHSHELGNLPPELTAAIGGGTLRSSQLLRVNFPVQLFRPATSEEWSGAPCLVEVQTRYETMLAATPQIADRGWTGSFEVVGTVRWGSGMIAEFDIPAQGACITFAGSDGFELQVRAEGTATISARVHGAYAFVDSVRARPARRTLVHTLPGDNGTVRQIPAFASSYQVQALDPAAIAGANLDQLREPVVGAGGVLANNAIALGAAIPVVAGADSYRIQGGAANTYRTVWELQL